MLVAGDVMTGVLCTLDAGRSSNACLADSACGACRANTDRLSGRCNGSVRGRRDRVVRRRFDPELVVEEQGQPRPGWLTRERPGRRGLARSLGPPGR